MINQSQVTADNSISVARQIIALIPQLTVLEMKVIRDLLYQRASRLESDCEMQLLAK